MIPRVSFLLAGFLSLISTAALQADVRLPAIFGNHMVLQQDVTLPVWGWADPGEKVTVTFGANSAETVAGPDSKWRVNLAPMPTGTPSGTLVIAGKNILTLQDVLVGDVWLCSGQSNMVWKITDEDAKKLTAAAQGQIRFFQVARKIGLGPRENGKGSWTVCKPGAVTLFSAVGALFGGNLLPILNRPIGLIEADWGGTSVQAWTSLPGLQSDPAFAAEVKNYEDAAAHYPGGADEFEAAAAAADKAINEWAKTMRLDLEYQAALNHWKVASEAAKTAKQAAPPRPVYSIPRPESPKIHENTPSALFNSLINPLVPFAIKGVIWYQGEANVPAALEYRKRLATLIADWRAHWKQGDFPFLFVQLPNFRSPPKTPQEKSDWSLLREAQLQTLAIPKTGMAVTIDVGSSTDLHPPDKTHVARRLALVARKVAYGEDLVYSGPLFDSVKPEKGQMRVTFKPGTLGGGLIIGSAPENDGKPQLPPEPVLRGFAIAGKDQKWVWADAEIEGASVIVSSPEVSEPVAVRYAWADNPIANLYNKEGLPASPFRSDDWNLEPASK